MQPSIAYGNSLTCNGRQREMAHAPFRMIRWRNFSRTSGPHGQGGAVLPPPRNALQAALEACRGIAHASQMPPACLACAAAPKLQHVAIEPLRCGFRRVEQLLLLVRRMALVEILPVRGLFAPCRHDVSSSGQSKSVPAMRFLHPSHSASGTNHLPPERREAERRQAHQPGRTLAGAAARLALKARSPLGAPPRLSLRRPNATAQPRPALPGTIAGCKRAFDPRRRQRSELLADRS
jgi:hypothetical protein